MDLKEARCPHCGHLLFYARVADVEIKCMRCKRVVQVKIKEQSEPHIK
ncbi:MULTISPECIES: Com family DNA-binding transcriptional regulator [Bacillales]